MIADTDAPTRRRRPGRPARTPEQRAAARSRMLTGAMDAVRSTGPDLTLDELAAAAGVSKPVFYDEFGGRVGLADAIALSLATGIEATVSTALAGTEALDVHDLVRSAISSLIEVIETEPNLYLFVVRAMRSTDRGFLDNALVRELARWANQVFAVLDPSIDRALLLTLSDGLFGFLFAAIESWQGEHHDAVEREQLVDTVAAVVATALSTAAALDGRNAGPTAIGPNP